MNEVLLSDSEKEILEWMWKEDKEYSYRDVAAQFGEDSEKGWKKQTLSTFLTRMEQKVSYLSGVKGKSVLRKGGILRR